MEKIDRVAIIGVGLIGGSLGLALKKAGFASEIIGIGRNRESLEKACELGAVDWVTTDTSAGVKHVDIVVVATPISVIFEIIPKISPLLPSRCIVTDVGSTKQKIVEEMDLLPINFVGGHPISGSEKRGIDAAREDLFLDATVVLTPTRKTDRHALQVIISLWENIGSHVLEMDPKEHDLLLAITSHLPHIAASSLVEIVSTCKHKDVPLLLGKGFKDTTRIAESDPILWRDICLSNKEVIVKVLSKYREIIANFEQLIARGDKEQLTEGFSRAKKWREKIDEIFIS
ncbi:MAG: prephenate dehydrogenase/arogenate dehydrogenase family protein [bacterium]|nr:prephenate dehydrogenase/arogenate dehydrogenase family protein [bacterium]